MLRFIARRSAWMVFTLIVVSILSFIIIELPPGDFVTTYATQLERQDSTLDQRQIEQLRAHYGLDKPLYQRYLKWAKNVLRGDLGRSLYWKRPVSQIIVDRLPWSILISTTSLVFVWALGLPIALISARRQYSIADYLFTFIGFIGLSIPSFLLALILMWVYFKATDHVAVGLFSDKYLTEPWSLAKLIDLLKHIWLPAIILGAAGCAGIIRILRANLLDELKKPYVMAARAKGLNEGRLVLKYPFRIAVNPVVSTIGWMLPALVSGELLVSMVMGIPTLAPTFLESLQNQDMFLAGSIVLILSALTVIGTLISDILLAWLDPRIRHIS